MVWIVRSQGSEVEWFYSSPSSVPPREEQVVASLTGEFAPCSDKGGGECQRGERSLPSISSSRNVLQRPGRSSRKLGGIVGNKL